MSNDADVSVGFRAEGTDKAAADVAAFEKSIRATETATESLDKSQKKASQSVASFEKEVRDAATGVTALGKSLQKASRARALTNIAKQAAELALEMGDAAAATALLEKELSGLDASDKEIERTVQQFERLKDTINETASAQDRFDATSKDVALAGDVESNLRAFGGAAGAAGLGGVGQGIGAVAEIPALIEAAPRLKESFKGLPAAAKAAGTAIGPVGVGLAAAVVVAAGVFAFASKGIKKDAEEARKALAARDEVIDISIRSGREGLEERRAIAVENKVVSDRQAAESREAQKVADEGFGFSDIFDPLIETEEDVQAAGAKSAEERSKQSQAVIDAIDLEIEALGEETEVREKSTDEILASVDAEGERVRFIQEASTLGVEATKDRLEGLKLEREVLQAQLAELEKAAAAGADVADEIANVEGSMASLGEQSQVLEGNLDSGAAAAVDASEKQKEAAEEAAQAQEQAAERTIAANQKYADALGNIALATERALSDASEKAAQAVSKLSQKQAEQASKAIEQNNRKRADIIQKGADDEIKQAAKTQNDLKKIRATGDKAIRNAARSRDFAALADAIIAKNEQLDEAKNASDDQTKERKAATKQALDDQAEEANFAKRQRDRDNSIARRDLQQSNAQRISDIRKAEARKSADAKTALSKELAAIDTATDKKLAATQEFLSREVALFQSILSGGGSASSVLGGSSPFSQTSNSSSLNISGSFNGSSMNQEQMVQTMLGIAQGIR